MLADIRAVQQFYSIYGVSGQSRVQLKDGVMPLYADHLPTGMKTLSVAEKTELFIDILLPVILRVNEDITKQREELLWLRERERNGTKLSWKEDAQLVRIFRLYGTELYDWEGLLRKNDIIPPSLVLAQGIIESGWGTSRFALQGNNLYGVHGGDGSSSHMVSLAGGVKVAAYDSIYEGTKAYMYLLNTGKAYREFRNLRFQARQKNVYPSSNDLAGTLLAYSERGSVYVSSLRSVMNRYRLNQYNHLFVDKNRPVVSIRFN